MTPVAQALQDGCEAMPRMGARPTHSQGPIRPSLFLWSSSSLCAPRSGLADKQILQYLPSSRDLLSAMLVSKSWCIAAYPLIWQRPSLASVSQFAGFVRALGTPHPLLPYPTTVRRLVFNSFARHLPDDLFSGITVCQHLERLTLPGAAHLSTATLLEVLGQLPELVSIDLSGMEAVDDKVVMKVASKCPQLQGLNLSKCKRVGDEGIVAVAHQLSALRRVSGPTLCRC